MDVVASQVNNLSGKIALETTQGKGTTFIIEIPPPELLVPSILVRAGERIFAIPTEEITITTIVNNLNIVPLEHSNYIYSSVVESEDGQIPILNLFNYWTDNYNIDSIETINRQIDSFAIAIYVKTPKLDRGIWLLADDLLEQRELVINSLPSPLKAPLGMMGLTLDLDGSLIPVLEPSTLAELILTSPEKSSFSKKTSVKNIDTTIKTPQAKSPTRTILIVDDAALMRRRLEVSLRAYGYNIHACVDGLDAWTWLQGNNPPDLLITDIEMPEMDGFTLINNCRNSGLDIPILVISSRLSEEWGKEARRLGATDYLTKGFATPDLIKKVSELLNLAVLN